MNEFRTSDYDRCRLCPRQCGVNRAEGHRGVCGETAACRIASIGPHFGEEPPISGTKGSGTIFFSGCPARCFFCQNYQISGGETGRAYEPGDVLREAEALALSGVHNLNFVTPDHFWPHVEWVCGELRARGHRLPFLFNGSGYHWPGMVDRMAGCIDIFLPDFKFADARLSREVLSDARYPELAIESIRRMVAHKGFLEPFDPEGRTAARQGVLVRHLVLPGETDSSLDALRILRREFGKFLPISLMSQYHPVPECQRRGRFTERVAPEEYGRVCDEMLSLGFEQVFIQPGHGDDDFMPDFRRDHPFQGNRRPEM